jgi:glutamate N-acetyltransferase/amino-acid N-acetyltransferase
MTSTVTILNMHYLALQGSPNYEDAHHIASVIARSPLVKTAIHGADANWGRILCATGYSTPSFAVDPTRVSVSFVPADGSEDLKLLINGEPQPVDEVRAKKILDLEDIEINVDLSMGEESAS